MADELRIKINEMGSAQTILGTEFVPIDNGVDTLKATLDQVKEHAIGDNNISALGDGSATGAILAVKSASESADDDIAETMAENGAHNHCPYPYHQASGTESNGATWTYNSNGVLSVSGTLTDSYSGINLLAPSHDFCEKLKNNSYKVVTDNLPSGVECQVYFQDSGSAQISIVTTGTITVPANAYYAGIYLLVYGTSGSGVSISNIKPLITLASDPSTVYAPHAMTNRELTENKLTLNSPDPLKEVFVESTVVSSMDMTSLASIKAFLTDYTGANHLGTSIVNVRSGSNGQRATFIISNVNGYAMAIMISFYNRDINSDCSIMAIYRAGSNWYSMPITGTWTAIS